MFKNNNNTNGTHLLLAWDKWIREIKWLSVDGRIAAETLWSPGCCLSRAPRLKTLAKAATRRRSTGDLLELVGAQIWSESFCPGSRGTQTCSFSSLGMLMLLISPSPNVGSLQHPLLDEEVPGGGALGVVSKGIQPRLSRVRTHRHIHYFYHRNDER